VQLEATCAELSELLGVTEKTICHWAKCGIMEKIAHNKYGLGESLRNWTAYQKCIHRGCDDPMAVWWIQRDIDWSEAHPLPPYDPALLSSLTSRNLRRNASRSSATARAASCASSARGPQNDRSQADPES
jgi:hypothetical protein